MPQLLSPDLCERRGELHEVNCGSRGVCRRTAASPCREARRCGLIQLFRSLTWRLSRCQSCLRVRTRSSSSGCRPHHSRRFVTKSHSTRFLVKRISLFARDSRDLREMRDGAGLVHLVCFVHLVSLVYSLVWLNQTNEINQIN